MEFILPAVYLLVFFFLTIRNGFFRVPGLSQPLLLILLAVKVFSALIFLQLYSGYYDSSDFHTYFSDSQKIVARISGHDTSSLEAWDSSFQPLFFNGSRIMILLNVFLTFFSWGNIYVHVVFFCFLSFTGAVALLKAINNYVLIKSKVPLLVLFIPTVCFWTSAPLKETVVLCSLSFFLLLTSFGTNYRIPAFKLSAAITLIALIFFLKIYVAFALIPVLLVQFWISRSTSELIFVKYLSVFIVGASVLGLLAWISPRLNAIAIITQQRDKAISESKGGFFLVSTERFISVPYADSTSLERSSDSTFKISKGATYLSWPLENMADTLFVTNSSDTSSFRLLYAQRASGFPRNIEPIRGTGSFVKAVFVSVPAVLFQPTVFQGRSWLQLLPGLENLFVLTFCALMLIFFRPPPLELRPLLSFLIVFSVLLFVIVGLTTANFGAMIRYRSVALPFFILFVLTVTDWNRIARLLKRNGDQGRR